MKKLLLAACMTFALASCDRFTSPETRVERAEAAMARGEHRAAVVDLMNALQKQPDNERARIALAEAALWLGDPVGAERELDRVKSPPDARRALLEARVALALGRADDVIDALAKSTFEFAPGQREFLLGQAYLQADRPAEAESSLEAAARADPKLVEARALALEARGERGERAAALVELARLTQAEPTSAAAWMTQGMMLAADGKAAAAAQSLARAHEHGGKQLDLTRRVTVLATLVEVQLLEGDLEAARTTQQSLARLAPDALVARYVASRIAMADNDHDAAATELRKIVEVAPNLQQARLLLAMALVAQGNLEQAGRELNTLLEQAPQNVVARQLLAQVRMRLDDPDGALRMLVPALGTEGAGGEVNALIDAARSQLGAAQSVSLLEQMLAKEPGNRALETQLATAYLHAGQAARAAELLRRGGDTADARRAALLVSAIASAEGSPAARAQVDALVAAHRDDARIAQLAAVFYTRAGDAAAGRRVLDDALSREGAERPTLLLALAQLEWSAGNRAAADVTIGKLLTIEPENPAARMAAGQSALARGALTDARAHFETVRRARPDSVDARLLLAQVSLAENQAAQADELLEEAVELAPRASVRNAAGMLNLNFGRADRALEHFRAAVELEPADPIGWFNLARTQRMLGQAGAARDSLQKALGAKPDWLPASAALVALDLEAKDPDAARARVAALRKSAPRDPQVLVLEADVFAATLDFAKATAALESAYALAPAAATALKDYRARAAGNLPEPTRLIERWLAAHPEDAQARAVLADVAMRRGDRAVAAEQYRQLLGVQPRDVVAMNNLAWLYHQMRDARAQPLARRAVALAPRSAAVNDTLGWMLVEQGAAAEGLPYLATAAAQPDADAEIRYHHAAALARTGRSAEAKRALEGALSTPVFPSRGEAAKLLAELAERTPGTP